jgi:hypothetical protein
MPRCGFCHHPLEALQENIVKVASCGHNFHQGCFFNEQGIHIKTTKKFKEIVCPEEGCRKKILKADTTDFSGKILEKIEIKQNPNKSQPVSDKDLPTRDKAKKGKDFTLLKKTAYAIAAFCETLLALVISPTWLGLGVGLVLSVPCAWFVGKIIDISAKKLI